MRTTTKILLVGLVLCIFALIILANIAESLYHKTKSQESVISEKNDSIHYHKAKNGQIVAEKIAAEMRAKDIEKNYPEIANQVKALGIELKSVKAIMQTGFTAHGSGNSYITHNHYDSAGREQNYMNLDVTDGYLTFHATVYDSTRAPYLYHYSDEITAVFHSKKKWFMGNEKLYWSGSLKNPNAKVTSSTDILIQNYRDKRWSVGPYIGYDVIRNKPSAGISLQWALFKF